MATSIETLFSDFASPSKVRETEASQRRKTGEFLATNPTANYGTMMMPERAAQAQKAIGGMLGVETRSEAEILAESNKKLFSQLMQEAAGKFPNSRADQLNYVADQLNARGKPKEAAKAMDAANKLREEERTASAYTYGAQEKIVDSEGNYFFTTTRRKKTGTGETYETVYTPVGHNKTEPVGETKFVESFGRTSDEDVAAATEKARQGEEAKNFAKARSNAVTELPTLARQIENVRDTISLAKKVKTGGFTNAIATEAQKFFGTTPKNKAEFNLRTAELMFARLKPLFGGVISEGEREAIVEIYANIQKNPEANEALLMDMADKLEKAYQDAKLYRDSKTFSEYMENTKRYDTAAGEPEKTEQPKAKPTMRYNPTTGKLEPVQ